MTQDLTKLPLHEVLLANGFELDRNKSSRNNPVLFHRDKDLKIIVSKKGENYLYFNRHIELDRGNIINFARNHGYDLAQMVANFDKNIQTAKHYNYFFSESNTKFSEINASKAYKEFAKANVRENKLLEMRGFNKEFMAQYQGFIKEDSYHNLIIPNYKLGEIDESLTNGQEKSVLAVCGYTKRLVLPITKDREGNALEKPLKNIQYGSKGIEILNINKDSKDIQHIIITESIFDSLALAQMRHFNANETLLLSTAGQFGDNIKESLKYIIKQTPNAKIILGFDNDKQGEILKENMTNFVIEEKKQFPINLTPFCKDFNEDLKLQNITQLEELNKQNYEQWIDNQISNYHHNYKGETQKTQKNAKILQSIRKAHELKEFPQEKKEAFNKKPKHKAIKSL